MLHSPISPVHGKEKPLTSRFCRYLTVSHLHALYVGQVCYADVKPANFLLKDRFPTPAASSLRTQQPCRQLPPDVRIIDFGCAQRVTEGTKLQKRTGAAPPRCVREQKSSFRWRERVSARHCAPSAMNMQSVSVYGPYLSST